MEAAFDFQMPLLVVSLAGAAGLIIYLISVFGIREKTFEEAIAAQKEISVELLGRKDQKKKAVKRKVKNKKEEKALVKEKEKEVAHQAHQHVEICAQPPTILDENSTVRRPSLIVGSRRDSIRSILVNKSEVSPIVEGEGAGETNHFELSHPKDDCELKKQISQEDDDAPNEGGEETNCVEGEDEGVISETLLTKTEAPIVEAQLTNTNSVPTGSLRKTASKKPKKTQGPDSELNATKLTSVIDKVTLSSDEIQNLIEYLLNRQNDAGITTEWVNTSKSDTTASLKKTLAERENQLVEEQATVETLQQKLKDIRLEFGTERSRWTGMKKQVEDRNATLLQETQQLQVRLQQLNGAIGEKQTLERQVQELQRRTQGLHDENLNLKNVLSAEQSFRMKGEGLEREAEALRTQCSHLESQLKSSFQSNSDLATQLRGLQEHTRGLDMKIVDFEHLQGFNAQLQDRENHLINELKRVEGKHLEADAEKNVIKDKLRDVEASLRLNKEESERRVEESHQSEKNAKNLLQDTKSSLGQMESQLKAKEGDLKALNDEKESLLLEVKVLNEKCVGFDQGLEDRLVESKGTIGSLTAEKFELNHQITEIRSEFESLRENNNELQREYSRFSEIILRTNLELEQTKHKLEQSTHEVEQTKHEMEQTKYKLEQSKHEVEKIQETLEQTKLSLDQVKLESEETKQDLYQREKYAEGINNEVEQTKLELKHKKHELEQAKHDFDQSKHEFEQSKHELEQTKQELEQTKHEVKQTKHEAEQIKHKLEQIQPSLELSNKHLEEAQQDLERTKQNMERTELNLQTERKAREKEDQERENEKKESLSTIQNELETLTGIHVQKNSKSWIEDFAKAVESNQKPPAEDKSAEIQKLQGEVEHYQAALKTTESLLRSLEQSIESAENDWKEKIRLSEEEMEVLRKTSSTHLQNSTHLETELGLQRETNSRLIKKIEDLETSHGNSNSQKEDTPSIASVEELKLENEGLRAEVQRLNHSTHSEVANGNGTSPKSLSTSTITVDSKGGESRSGEPVVPISPAGELKKKKKGASARK